MYRILMIDSDESFLQKQKIYFTEKKFSVYTANNCKTALKLIRSLSLDCVILDILLEKDNGYELCQTIKKISHVPVIFLTSLSDEEHLIKGFRYGADDYLTKSDRFKELEMRIYARIRQATGNKVVQSAIEYPPLSIDPMLCQVTIHDTLIPLTIKEYEILLFLASHKNTTFSQDEIFHAVWKEPNLDDTHTVRVHVGQLRRKLQKACPEKKLIHTIWGKGYAFIPSI